MPEKRDRSANRSVSPYPTPTCSTWLPSSVSKFRGTKLVGREANRVTETALANYVVNSDPDEVDHGLESKPLLAFAVCYVTAHLALDLVDEKRAEAILNFCEKHLDEDIQ